MALERNIKKIAGVLNEFARKKFLRGYTLIGGLAVSVWGYPRATKDMDFIVSLGSARSVEDFAFALKKKGLKTKIFKGAPGDPVPRLVKIFCEDAPADILIATKKWEEEIIERSVNIKFGGVAVPVISVEYLIAMKLKAGGARDIADAEELLKIGEVDLKTLDGLAKRLKIDKRLAKVKNQ